MSNFNIAVLGILMAVALIAVLILSGAIPLGSGGGGGKAAQITMWGALPSGYFSEAITEINDNNNFFKIKYVEKDSSEYENDLINALASGSGPDLWLIDQRSVLKQKDKIFIAPFSSLSKRSFKDVFTEEGELFFDKDGVIALPLIVDPLVAYWNRDLFNSKAISTPPEFWDEFVAASEKLTERDASDNIIRSGAGLGEFINIEHAKDIISLLVLQTGNPIIDSLEIKSVFSEDFNLPVNPAESAVRFFTEFSNPKKPSYSWNRSLPNSKNAFIAGILAMYFGYAGEYRNIVEKNPHLNFDAAVVPQIKDGVTKMTFGKIMGVAVSKSSGNKEQGLKAANALASKNSVAEIAKAAFLPPARRDLLKEAADDSALSVFYKSAVISRGWLEPDEDDVSNLFKEMIESTITGRKKIYEAARDVDYKLDIMLGKFKPQ